VEKGLDPRRLKQHWATDSVIAYSGNVVSAGDAARDCVATVHSEIVPDIGGLC